MSRAPDPDDGQPEERKPDDGRSHDGQSDEGIGCRAGVLSGVSLLAAAIVVGGIGLWLVLRPDCVGACPEWGLTLFYAGAPASALFGVVGGGIPIAWPLDAAIWLVAGLGAATWADRRGLRPSRVTAAVGAAALVYGFLLARLVEVDRTLL